MEFVFKRQSAVQPQLSFVLLDWSCRESLHLLDYLSKQTVPRERYEILWIEYYQKRSDELCQRLAAAEAAAAAPPVDTYVILGMPASTYYHKHLLYNVGIVLARGRILCICDSDAMAQPSLVESILKEFQADPNIVLHLDEVRNNSRRFYPFNYPEFEDLVGEGCANWLNGRPSGLSDHIDPLHTRNYGACLCARRDDLIAIGGADMHMDYVGHICGPYEMTWRLVNSGRREVWHQSEWLYHVWHPGQAGDANYAGPHDGLHVSTTALRLRETGRVEPLVANRAIATLRQEKFGVDNRDVLGELVDPAWYQEWDVAHLEGTARRYRVGTGSIAMLERSSPGMSPGAEEGKGRQRLPKHSLGRAARLQLLPLVCRQLWRQLRRKYGVSRLRIRPVDEAVMGEPVRKVRALLTFLRRMLGYNRHLLSVCWQHLCYVVSLGKKEVVLYGDGEAAQMLCALARFLPLRVRAVCPFEGSEEAGRLGQKVWSSRQLARYEGAVLVAAFVNTAAHVARLEELGLRRERLIVLE